MSQKLVFVCLGTVKQDAPYRTYAGVPIEGHTVKVGTGVIFEFRTGDLVKVSKPDGSLVTVTSRFYQHEVGDLRVQSVLVGENVYESILAGTQDRYSLNEAQAQKRLEELKKGMYFLEIDSDQEKHRLV